MGICLWNHSLSFFLYFKIRIKVRKKRIPPKLTKRTKRVKRVEGVNLDNSLAKCCCVGGQEVEWVRDVGRREKRVCVF